MDTDRENIREKNRQISRKEAVLTGMLGTLVVLCLLAGLAWLIHTILTQPVSTVSSSSGEQSPDHALAGPSAAEDRQAARRRAAEKVALAEIPGDKTGQAAKGVHGVSPVDISAAVRPAASARLPDVVNLDGLRDSNSPPRVPPVDVSGIMPRKQSNVAPVDISGITAARPGGVGPVNIGPNSPAAAGGVSPVAIARSPASIHLPKPVVIGPMRPGDEDNLAPPELRAKLKSIKRLCTDHAGNVFVGTEDSLFRYSPNAPARSTAVSAVGWLPGGKPTGETPVLRRAPAAQRWTQMAAKELGDNGVSALAVDRLGRLWVGTDHGGVLVYNGDAWAQYEIVGGVTRPDSRSGPIGQHVFRIGVNPADGDVWISTEGGLSRYSEKSDSWSYFTRGEGLPCDNILGIAFTPNGDIYCASDCNGLIMGAAADGYKTWRTIATGPVQEPATASGSGLPSNLLNDVLVGRDGTIYVASDAGLAYRRPGQDWQYLRGSDWAAKVKGRLDGPPPGWDERASAAAPAPLLEEDYCTCLAEDGNGSIWLGHQASYEVIDPKDLSRKPGYLTRLNVSAILPVGNSALIAGYGDGLFEEGSVHLESASTKVAIAPLPSAAAPPTLAQLNEMLARLESVNLLAPENQAPVVALPDDWLTRGDWLGRYGGYWACLAAMAWPNLIWGGGPEEIQYCARIDPRVKKDSLRYWVTKLYTDDPRVLEMPAVYMDSRLKKGLTKRPDFNRRDSYWDDHSEVTAASREGPNVLCTVRIPAGEFRLSLYFADALRDFRISLREHSSSQSVYESDGFENERELAHSRMVDSRAGVWKRFFVQGPRDVTIVVERNHSHNTNLPAVMLDTLDERPMPYFMTKKQYQANEQELRHRREELSAKYKPMGRAVPAITDADVANRMDVDLRQTLVLSSSYYLSENRIIWAEAARWLKSRPRNSAMSSDDFQIETGALYSLCLLETREDCQKNEGIRTAREIEQSLHWDGVTNSYEGKRFELLRSSAPHPP